MATSDKPTDFINSVCATLADQAIEAAQNIANSAPANAGQDTLCSELPIEDQWEGVYSGEGPVGVEANHPEAIGLIVDEINAVLEEGMNRCMIARETITWADVF